jgi:hypothetical protein
VIPVHPGAARVVATPKPLERELALLPNAPATHVAATKYRTEGALKHRAERRELGKFGLRADSVADRDAWANALAFALGQLSLAAPNAPAVSQAVEAATTEPAHAAKIEPEGDGLASVETPSIDTPTIAAMEEVAVATEEKKVAAVGEAATVEESLAAEEPAAGEATAAAQETAAVQETAVVVEPAAVK